MFYILSKCLGSNLVFYTQSTSTVKSGLCLGKLCNGYNACERWRDLFSSPPPNPNCVHTGMQNRWSFHFVLAENLMFSRPAWQCNKHWVLQDTALCTLLFMLLRCLHWYSHEMQQHLLAPLSPLMPVRLGPFKGAAVKSLWSFVCCVFSLPNQIQLDFHRAVKGCCHFC